MLQHGLIHGVDHGEELRIPSRPSQQLYYIKGVLAVSSDGQHEAFGSKRRPERVQITPEDMYCHSRWRNKIVRNVRGNVYSVMIMCFWRGLVYDGISPNAFLRLTEPVMRNMTKKMEQQSMYVVATEKA